jgi:hypothetical protein
VGLFRGGVLEVQQGQVPGEGHFKPYLRVHQIRLEENQPTAWANDAIPFLGGVSGTEVMPNGVSNDGTESTIGVGKACRVGDRGCCLEVRPQAKSELLHRTRRYVRAGKPQARKSAQDGFAESAATGADFQDVAPGLVNEQSGNDAGSSFEAETSGCGSMPPPALARMLSECVEVMSFGVRGECGHCGVGHSKTLSPGTFTSLTRMRPANAEVGGALMKFINALGTESLRPQHEGPWVRCSLGRLIGHVGTTIQQARPHALAGTPWTRRHRRGTLRSSEKGVGRADSEPD